ncbi:putative protein kinase [Tribonema minus]|uniref:Uncharacterized protein n=1 Tax=Tribonema minus TaxID=303371 RepID=A0A835Z0T5_9STRA|nr:putative protein kinase [Tribonema minus]
MFHDDANQCSANSTPTTAAASPAPTPRTSAAVPRHGEVCHDALASLCSEPRVTLPFPKAELTFIRVSGTGTSRDPQGSAYTAYFLDVKCPGASAPLWRVHRRFKEFRALDEDLRRGGFMPPPLPPRRLIGLLDPLIVAQRREELEAWLYQLIDAATADVPHLQSFEPFRAFLLANADNPPSPMEVNKELWELHGGELGEGEGGDAAGEGQGGQGRGAEGRQRVGLADFEQMRVIGKGSFGKVTLVRKRSCGRLFAMKALAKSHLERSKQVEHTRTERHVLGRIKHPFIVGMHYAWTTRAKVYFVLDYCAGGELFFHLSQRKRMPEYMARFYAAEITLALEHLHGCDIAYRDLKPENIILDMEGHIKLADFGLAKTGVRHSAHGATSLCGTPEYLSPEILNRRGHGTAVDWWGLGMVIFEMLTGLPPWYTTDRRKLFQRLRSGPLSFPAGVVSCTAADAIARLLRRDPLARLGGGARGASDVKDHPFFKSVDWRALLAREVRPPFAPCPRARSSSGGGGGGGADTRNFDAQFTRLPLDSVEVSEASP